MPSLELSDSGLTSLDSISSSNDIVSLNVSFNTLSDISNISKLSQLSSINLSHNQLTNLSPLSSLHMLKVLNISSNPVIDLSPLSSCSNLETLVFARNHMSSLSALNCLSNLHLQTLLLAPSDLSSSCKHRIYKDYIHNLFPQLICLDGKQISSQSLLSSRNYLSSKEGKSALKKFNLSTPPTPSPSRNPQPSPSSSNSTSASEVGDLELNFFPNSRGLVVVGPETSVERNRLFKRSINFDHQQTSINDASCFFNETKKQETNQKKSTPSLSIHSSLGYSSSQQAVIVFSDGSGVAKRRDGRTAIRVCEESEGWVLHAFYDNKKESLAVMVDWNGVVIQSQQSDVIASIKNDCCEIYNGLQPDVFSNFFVLGKDLAILVNPAILPEGFKMSTKLPVYNFPSSHSLLVLYQFKSKFHFYFACDDLTKFSQPTDPPLIPQIFKISDKSNTPEASFSDTISSLISDLDSSTSNLNFSNPILYSSVPRPVTAKSSTPVQESNEEEPVDEFNSIRKKEQETLDNDRKMLADFRSQLKFLTGNLP
ncbi:hypothetical protein GEMRC1_003023 [Eukaryota sp. GEM-RC1]